MTKKNSYTLNLTHPTAERGPVPSQSACGRPPDLGVRRACGVVGVYGAGAREACPVRPHRSTEEGSACKPAVAPDLACNTNHRWGNPSHERPPAPRGGKGRKSHWPSPPARECPARPGAGVRCRPCPSGRGPLRPSPRGPGVGGSPRLSPPGAGAGRYLQLSLPVVPGAVRVRVAPPMAGVTSEVGQARPFPGGPFLRGPVWPGGAGLARTRPVSPHHSRCEPNAQARRSAARRLRRDGPALRGLYLPKRPGFWKPTLAVGSDYRPPFPTGDRPGNLQVRLPPWGRGRGSPSTPLCPGWESLLWSSPPGAEVRAMPSGCGRGSGKDNNPLRHKSRSFLPRPPVPGVGRVAAALIPPVSGTWGAPAPTPRGRMKWFSLPTTLDPGQEASTHNSVTRSRRRGRADRLTVLADGGVKGAGGTGHPPGGDSSSCRHVPSLSHPFLLPTSRCFT
ncbi:hypothetical protein SUDANB121_03172 [Nocardiopsis dassonvillei]